MFSFYVREKNNKKLFTLPPLTCAMGKNLLVSVEGRAEGLDYADLKKGRIQEDTNQKKLGTSCQGAFF